MNFFVEDSDLHEFHGCFPRSKIGGLKAWTFKIDCAAEKLVNYFPSNPLS